MPQAKPLATSSPINEVPVPKSYNISNQYDTWVLSYVYPIKYSLGFFVVNLSWVPN